MNKERVIELATLAIQGMIEDDRKTAIEYMHDTMDMTIEECNFYGVQITEEELNEYEWERTCSICGKR